MRMIRGVRLAGAIVLGAALLVSGGCGVKTQPVPPATVLPAPIEDLRYAMVDDLVRLTWSYPLKTINGKDISDISSFNLYRAEIPLEDYCPSCPVPFVEPIEVDGGVTVIDGKRRVASYDYDMLRSGHKYFFKVQSRAGWWADSGDSNIITFVWHVPAVAPTGVTASAANSKTQLSWQPVTTRRDGEPVTTDVLYRVLRKSGDKGFSAIGSPVEETSFADSNVVDGKEYFYQVQSILRFGDDLVYGGLSEELAVIPADTTPPAVPEGVLAFGTGAGNRVIWDRSNATDIAGYKIYRRSEDSGGMGLVGSVNAPSTTFIDTSVKEGVRYYYRVTAFDKTDPANESGKSKEATPRY